MTDVVSSKPALAGRAMTEDIQGDKNSVGEMFTSHNWGERERAPPLCVQCASFVCTPAGARGTVSGSRIYRISNVLYLTRVFRSWISRRALYTSSGPAGLGWAGLGAGPWHGMGAAIAPRVHAGLDCERRRRAARMDTEQRLQARRQGERDQRRRRRAAETDERREARLQRERDQRRRRRAAETDERREARLQRERDQQRSRRAAETVEHREARLQQRRSMRAAETVEQREARSQYEQDQRRSRRVAETVEHREERLQQRRSTRAHLTHARAHQRMRYAPCMHAQRAGRPAPACALAHARPTMPCIPLVINVYIKSYIL